MIAKKVGFGARQMIPMINFISYVTVEFVDT